MSAEERHRRIISLLGVNEHLSLDRMAAETEVSRETVRRDIVRLEQDGKLQRVHGGVVRAAQQEPPFESRLKARTDAKHRIGGLASRLIEPGMLCAIDAGSTTVAFAAALAGRPDVTIVTNSIDVATAVRTKGSGSDVVLLGGRLGPDLPGTYGEQTIAEMRRFTPKIAVFSPVALSGVNGAMYFHLAEAEFTIAMIQSAERVVVLADHSKIASTSRIQVCKCSRIDVLVTDRLTGSSKLADLRSHGLQNIMVA